MVRVSNLHPLPIQNLPISTQTWGDLVDCNRRAVTAGLSSAGVFAPGIGPDYEPDGKRALLYVGKSAGPLGKLVGSDYNQAASIQSSTEWMVERRNKSAFWQFLEIFDKRRRSVAWTNICKMDQNGGLRPPTASFWNMVAEPHLRALGEEIETLKPRVVLFATSGYAGDDVRTVLLKRGYELAKKKARDEHTRIFAAGGGRFAVETRHPQGWSTDARSSTVGLLHQLLDG